MALFDAVKPLAYKMAMGHVQALTPDQWHTLLEAAMVLLRTRLEGDAAAYRVVLDKLQLDHDIAKFITELLWSHYAPVEKQRTDIDMRQNGQRENLPGPFDDPGH